VRSSGQVKRETIEVRRDKPKPVFRPDGTVTAQRA
jgi:hypothetical protein